MVIEEKLYAGIEKLPESLRAELMDFIEYLLAKAEREEEKEWNDLSLSSAVRGIEKEKSLYSPSDLKVTFS